MDEQKPAEFDATLRAMLNTPHQPRRVPKEPEPPAEIECPADEGEEVKEPPE